MPSVGDLVEATAREPRARRRRWSAIGFGALLPRALSGHQARLVHDAMRRRSAGAADPLPRLHEELSSRSAASEVERSISGAVVREAVAALERAYPQWVRDQWSVMDPGAGEGERAAAVTRLVELVPWFLREGYEGEKEALEAIRRRAKEEGREPRSVRDEILRTAIVLVLGDIRRLHRQRLGSGEGSGYLRDGPGDGIGVRPIDLPLAAGVGGRSREGLYLYWFRRQVQRVACALALDEDPLGIAEADDEGVGRLAGSRRRPSVELVSLDELGSLLEESTPDPLEVLLVNEDANALLALASPRQAELCEELMAGETLAAAARKRGMSEGTASGQFDRLRKKARKSM